ncbi:MAG: hypothetical protein QM736_10405 [Vicinamibacterales bacterium]
MAYSGKTSTTVDVRRKPGDSSSTCSITDYSEKGGGATGCCWTTSMIKVNVK